MASTNIPQVEFFKKKGVTSEFEILALEDLFSKHNTLTHPLDRAHRVQFHNILYITSGTGTHHIDFKPYTYRPGSLIFISQGQVHSFYIHPDIKGFLILFTTEYLEHNLIHSDVISLYQLYNYHLHSPVINPEETKNKGFHSLVKEIWREYDEPEIYGKEEISRLLLKALLLKAERIKQTVTAEQKNTMWINHFGRFKEQLDKHIVSTRSVKNFAEMLSVSTKHLNTICKSVSGMTAKRYIDNTMILEIKRRLATSHSSIQELSYELGFEEPTNFVKYFKQRTGQSPAQFRKTFTK